MRASCRSNARQVSTRFQYRILRVPRELAEVAREAATVLREEAVRIMSARIYAVPIPTSPTGRPLWRRTGRLRNRERARGLRNLVVMRNDTRYARARHNLGRPGFRQPRYTQSVQWQWEAVARKRSWILQRRRDALRKANR